MTTQPRRRANVLALALVASLLPGADLAADCLTNPEVTINGSDEYPNPYPLLGSPSGLAGNGAITFGISAGPGETYSELWFFAGYEPARSGAILFHVENDPWIPDQHVDCDDDNLGEAIYLDIGTTFFPIFGGAAQDLGLAVKCPPTGGGMFGVQTLGITFNARSTDIEGDGDTDEDDADLLRAAFNTTQTRYDLDFNGSVNAQDLAILINEASRRQPNGEPYLRFYTTSSWADDDCVYEPLQCPNSPCDCGAPCTGTSGGYRMMPPAEPVVTLSVLNATTTQLSWPAVADDQTGPGASQPAASYEIRRSSAVITNANWANATIAATAGPADLGTTVLVNVSRPSNTSCAWYYAVKAKDDVNNWSAISNVTTDQIDTTAPSAVTLTGLSDLTAIKLTWTAPGDDGTVGQAVAYDMRYSTSPITAANFDSAEPVPGGVNPSAGGTPECFVVNNLDPCTKYYWALKTSDDCGNLSAMSNVLLKKTRCAGIISVSCEGSKGSVEEEPEVTALEARGPAVVQAGTAEFRLSIPAQLGGVPVRAAIYDVRGQVVRMLVSGDAQAGVNDLRWDLRNDHGQEAASGVYYMRAQVGAQSVSSRVVVAR